MEKYVITHNGRFHHDELLAISILRKINPNIEILRTRSYEEIQSIVDKNMHIAVVDVFDKYIPELRLFDHHQNGFKEVYNAKFNIKLSSAGLIYKHYRKELFHACGCIDVDRFDALYSDEIYEEFIMYVDANDNGIPVEYSIRPRTISDIVKTANVSILTNNDEDFMGMLNYISEDLHRYIEAKIKEHENYSYLHDLIKNTTTKEDRILVVNPNRYNDKLLIKISLELGRDFIFIIFETEQGNYRGKGVPLEAGSFKVKKPFKKEWCGFRKTELQKISKIQDAEFVHINGFLAECRTFEAILEMCNQTINDS